MADKSQLQARLVIERLETRDCPTGWGNPDGAALTLSINAETGIAGDPIALIAVVRGVPVPGGSVSFSSAGRSLGSAPVTGGRATLTTDTLPAGTDTVTASYSGDPGHAPSGATTTVALAAPSADSQFISGVLADVGKQYEIPGLTAAVVVNGQVITGAAGVRQAGINETVETGDSFRNGSTTKAITATLAGILVERGVINWNTTIDQVFPELKGKIDPRYDTVTLRELLSHSSGVANEDVLESPQVVGAAEAAITGKDPTDGRAALLPLILSATPVNPVGTFHYSNLNYLVAAAMMERLTGQSYESLVQRNIFDPLGMTTASFVDPNNGLPASAVTDVVGHDYNGEPVDGSSSDYLLTNLTVQDAAGANLNMSIGDWARFIKAQLGETVNGVRLLDPATLATLHTTVVASDGGFAYGTPTGYAQGWFTDNALLDVPGLGPSISHQGDLGDWWASEVVAFPDAGFATLIFSNRQGDAATGAEYQDPTNSAFAEIRQRLDAHFAPRVHTTVTLTAHSETGVAGDPVTLTAIVSNGQATTGTVTFAVGNAVLGTAPVVNGTATLTPDHLPAGTTPVTAAYAVVPGRTLSRARTTVRLAAP